MEGILYLFTAGVRLLAVLAFAGSAVIALTHWAVRRQYLAPFGLLPRSVRKASDPVLRPIEHQLVRHGGNPQDAPGWMLGLTVAGGLVLIGVVDWLIRLVLDLLYAFSHPFSGGLAVLLGMAFSLVNLALIVRFFVSWLPVSPHARWLRPVRLLTDWLVEPIRRILPNVGPFDFSLLVAWFLLAMLRTLVIRALV